MTPAPAPPPTTDVSALDATLLRLRREDSVSISIVDLPAGATAGSRDGETVLVLDPVPAGHKIAMADIPAGGTVTKFGVAIGTATTPIRRGQHVHVHNVESERMRGDRG